MSEKFEPTKKGARDLTRYLDRRGKGTTVYTVAEGRDWGLGSERVYNKHTFTGRSWGSANWTTGHYSPTSLLSSCGTVYTEPPRGVRFLGDPAPQVAGPLGNGDYEGVLDEAELRGLEKQARQASNPKTRRRPGIWRV
ncbi:hypothetical protein ADL07_11680 [Streptomyces sp. NRRL F-4707]|uniref:hypothetical protein n=1 Tax=Streptomyces sp. NRRL F-4707 TaxID=1519496 RepID=UPI0006AF0FDC|nr:hypothetical protein [Streptomyces sp. NRRL F-4707]KOX32820.1 hypothetical protein ADL07_11680 [Streptomyces sp. NRRL F-4707]